jgi:hypothetical protein
MLPLRGAVAVAAAAVVEEEAAALAWAAVAAEHDRWAVLDPAEVTTAAHDRAEVTAAP